MSVSDDRSEQDERPDLVRQFELAQRLGQIGHWYWTIGAPVVEWSTETYRIHGVDPETFVPTLEAAVEAYHPDDRDTVTKALEQSIASGETFNFEARIKRGDGTTRIVSSVGECKRSETSEVVAMFGVIQDITEMREAESALAKARKRHEDFAAISSDWMWEMGPDLRFSYMSPRVREIVDVSPEYYIGKTRQELNGDAVMSPEMEEHLKILEQRKPFNDFRLWINGPKGNRLFISASGVPIYDEHGSFAGYRGTGRDITSEHSAQEDLLLSHRKLVDANIETSKALARVKEANTLTEQRYSELMVAQARVRHTALHDSLTGIANRRFLDQQLDTLMQRCRLSGDNLAVVHIDLDRFKQINDTMGHAVGDEVLIHTARTLRNALSTDDFVARVGGDEFVVLRTGRLNREDLSRLASELIETLSKPVEIEGRSCWFGVSIGIAVNDGAEFETRDLLVNADIALCRAKKAGGCFEFFTSQLQAEVIAYKQTADGILAGLAGSEFVAAYQPQVAASTFEVCGVEALVRWKHPDKGLLTPFHFLSVAEDLNVVDTIDRLVLEKGLDDLSNWQDAGLPIEKMSVNVSAKRLVDTTLIESIQGLKMPKGVLAFELLESIFFDEVDNTVAWNIDMLKEMGIQIELDDFGSGHASIISLVKLGPDAIKIDRELISTIAEEPSRCNLVRSIIEIGRSLGVKITAEGVETLDQALLLRNMGCDVLQGFYFAKPMVAEEIPDFIFNWDERRSSALA
jgi:diguanylate cyclase (GGDEF)-like protein/PAS domain S-box-containing protein